MKKKYLLLILWSPLLIKAQPFEMELSSMPINLQGKDLSIPFNVTTELRQNYPNPYHDITTIEYSLNSDSYIELSIFDFSGKKMYELEKGFKLAGTHQSGISREVLPSGVYYYRLKSEGLTQTRKFTVTH